MELLRNPTRAYLSANEMALCNLAMQWAMEENIGGSIPNVYRAEQSPGWIIHVNFGNCPSDSGVDLYFRVIEGLFIVWDTEDDRWNWDNHVEVNLSRVPGKVCHSLAEVNKLIRTGEI